MFRRLLIANRGEIAVRVIRACREMGITSIAVYSTADKNSLHAMLADESICIGPPDASESYLKIPNIIAAAVSPHNTMIRSSVLRAPILSSNRLLGTSNRK